MSREPQTVPYITQPEPSCSFAGNLRQDKRTFEDLRPCFFQTGTISQASGSAYAEFGSTKVMVGVYGPRQPTRTVDYSEEGTISCDVKFATFATRTRGKVGQSADEKALSVALQDILAPSVILSSFPKSQVDVYVTVIESGGSDFSVIASCASLALADAGVQLKDLLACCTVARVGGHLILDPTSGESGSPQAAGELILGTLTAQGRVIQSRFEGVWASQAMEGAMALALDGCIKVDAMMRQAIKQSIVAVGAQ